MEKVDGENGQYACQVCVSGIQEQCVYVVHHDAEKNNKQENKDYHVHIGACVPADTAKDIDEFKKQLKQRDAKNGKNNEVLHLFTERNECNYILFYLDWKNSIATPPIWLDFCLNYACPSRDVFCLIRLVWPRL